MTSSAVFIQSGPIETAAARRAPITDVKGMRVHMIGIGGSGMAGLAGVLLRRGAQLSGTDLRTSDALAQLSARGARITTAQKAEDLPGEVDLIVASAAVPRDHSQLIEGRRRGVGVMKYAEMLGTLMAARSGVAISGTHGKSTTTAWVAYILKSAGLDPSFVIGATVEQLGGSSGEGDGRHFVAEACEFDRSFLNLRPKCAAILNIEEDHLDCYDNITGIERAFLDFAGLVPSEGLLVLNGDDERCRTVAGKAKCPVQTFGFTPGCTWQAADLAIRHGLHSFALMHEGKSMGRIEIGLPGRHNVANALAAIALTHWCGVPWTQILRGLSDFSGARRRMSLCGAAGGIKIVDDYGHHPTEIRATLTALRQRYSPGRLWCVFQAHQYSRTRFMLGDFADSLTLADRVVIPDIYAARDSEEDRQAVCAADLAARIRDRGGQAVYIPDFEPIIGHLAGALEPGDLVVTMGAGNISEVAHGLLERLRGNLPA